MRVKVEVDVSDQVAGVQDDHELFVSQVRGPVDEQIRTNIITSVNRVLRAMSIREITDVQ